MSKVRIANVTAHTDPAGRTDYWVSIEEWFLRDFLLYKVYGWYSDHFPWKVPGFRALTPWLARQRLLDAKLRVLDLNQQQKVQELSEYYFPLGHVPVDSALGEYIVPR